MANIELVDADALVDADVVTVLSLAINQTMRKDAAARARYRAIYGVEWSPLPTVGGNDYFPTDTLGSTKNTVLAKGTR